MCKIVCVTNRKLCKGDFLDRIAEVARSKPDGIILREKDLSEEEYLALADSVITICNSYRIQCTLHTFVNAAIKLQAESIHLPLHILREMSAEEKSRFTHIGASCHSLNDVREATSLGADRVIAGHIFDTDCKKGLAGRGIDFLKDICANSPLPVYAIGGISEKNVCDVAQAGAQGVCIMSGFMQCEDPGVLISRLKGECP